MLDAAIKYKDELQKKFRTTWFEEKYKFWACGNFYEEFRIDDTTWNQHQFVSLDSAGVVIGYIGYRIDRGNDFVYSLNIINFTENKAVFGLDVRSVLIDIFNKFHFRKLCFTVIIGNPVEKKYDRLIRHYGGRIVGVQSKHVKLIDNQYYDEKLYEIFSLRREDNK